jgi:holo-[acyl-carrier protein] synthase
MNTVGHGIDIVDVAFFRTLCADPERESSLVRYFTPAEQNYVGAGEQRASRLAGRFAAKEAVLKALGVGWTAGIAWADVEIGALPSGAPTVILHARAAAIAKEQGVTRWLISISHTEAIATASAIALSA